MTFCWLNSLLWNFKYYILCASNIFKSHQSKIRNKLPKHFWIRNTRAWEVATDVNGVDPCKSRRYTCVRSKNWCVIVTMMLRNCLIPTLKAPYMYTLEKRKSMSCHWMLKLSLKHKIIKVMIQEKVIYPPGMNLLTFLNTFVYNNMVYRL